ncbi:MAG: hypothetical protein JSS66_04660 [Armatimonadetes bacterium]|nr:hypothetical protein [Armatimonadota bacterium]
MTWTARHVFTKSVVFSATQQFDVENLVDHGSRRGSVLWHDGSRFQRAVPSAQSKTLLFDGQRVYWGDLPLTLVSGVLSTEHGGTGLNGNSRGSVLFSPVTNHWEALPIGPENNVLTVRHGLPVWAPTGNLYGELRSGAVPVAHNSSVLIDSPISSDGSAVLVACPLNIEGGMVLGTVPDGACIGVGPALFVFGHTGAFRLGKVAFDDLGAMVSGGVPVSMLQGILPTTAGGTGLSKYRPGDMLIADQHGKLARLSAPTGAGWVLSLGKKGLPEWVDSAEITVAGGSRRVQLETDGESLYYVNAKNKRVQLQVASTPKKPLKATLADVSVGGTGSDLSTSLDRGAILLGRSRDAVVALSPGPQGSVLVSRGPQEMPEWTALPESLCFSDGLLVEDGIVSFDRAGEHTWSGVHSFLRGLCVGSGAELTLDASSTLVLSPRSAPDNPTIGSMWSDGDEVYYASRRGVQRMTQAVASSSHKRMVVVPVVSGALLSDCSYCGAVVPYSPLSPTSPSRWRLLRIDWLLLADSGIEASFDLVFGDRTVLPAPLTVLAGPGGSTEFTEAVFASGTVVQVHSQSQVPGRLTLSIMLEEF